MKTKRKSILISLPLLLIMVLSGCDFFEGLFNPLIGSWELIDGGGGNSITYTWTFRARSTMDIYVEAVSGGTTTGTASGSGSFTQDQEAGTLSYSIQVINHNDSSQETYSFDGTYSITGDTLTLTGAKTLTLTRQ